MSLCQSHIYETQIFIRTEETIKFHDSGHVLGSAILELFLMIKENPKKFLLWRFKHKSAVLMNATTLLTKADLVFMEGTYGNHNHRPIEITVAQLKEILLDTQKRGGNIMFPAFAVSRTQESLFYLGQLHREGLLDNWQVLLDSPMTMDVTKIYDHWFQSLESQVIEQATPKAHSIIKDFIPRLIFVCYNIKLYGSE